MNEEEKRKCFRTVLSDSDWKVDNLEIEFSGFIREIDENNNKYVIKQKKHMKNIFLQILNTFCIK